MVMKKPAEAALLPLTKTTTGIRDEVIAWTASSMEVTNPPGVSSSMMSRAASSSLAFLIASLR